jgi:hypothetical protein
MGTRLTTIHMCKLQNSVASCTGQSRLVVKQGTPKLQHTPKLQANTRLKKMTCHSLSDSLSFLD